MQKLLTRLLFFISLCSYSQTKEFIILDEISSEPIDLVQVLYPELEIGSVSNKDGRVRIPLKKSNVLLSHINYKERSFTYEDFIKIDTIYLSSNVNQLDEVVVYNINLLEKFSNILDKTYQKKYSTKKALHNSTYKETFSVNDSLIRLFQVQLDWWSKNGMHRIDKSITKQNKLALSTVDYSKIKKEQDSTVSSNSAHVENAIFFQFAHLNFLLSFNKNLGYDFEIKSIEKTANSVKVYFDGVLKQKGTIIYEHKNSLVVFNQDYSAINYLKFNMMYDSDFQDGYSNRNKMKYQRKTEKHVLELAFKPLKNNKLSISYYSSEIYGILKTKKFTDLVKSTQSVFVNKTELGKNLKNKEINFYKPFYLNIVDNKNNEEVKFLLTKKEKAFLNSVN